MRVAGRVLRRRGIAGPRSRCRQRVPCHPPYSGGFRRPNRRPAHGSGADGRVRPRRPSGRRAAGYGADGARVGCDPHVIPTERSSSPRARAGRDGCGTMVGSPPPSVALAWGPAQYDAPPPFSPGTDWPEYRRVARDAGLSPNGVYGTARESFRLLGLDAERYGTAAWNPLGSWIRPGDTVVLKPNFVREFRESSADHANCVITHGAVIRAVARLRVHCLGGRGRIVIADAPHNDADFSAIRRDHRPRRDSDVLSASRSALTSKSTTFAPRPRPRSTA